MPLKEGIFRYLLSILLGYVGWLILYEFFILPKSLLDEFVIDALVRVSEQLLNFLGFNVTSNHGFWANTISLDYFPGVWVSPNCDGLSVVAIFIIVVMSFPGEMKKLQTETQQILEEFKAYNSNIVFQFVNPLEEEEKRENKCMQKSECAKVGLLTIKKRKKREED